MIDGITVRMGGRDWIVPPLTLGQMRRLWPSVQKLGDVGAGMDAEQIGVVSEIVGAALSRNYPDMTPAQAEELLDLGNAGTVLHAVLTGSRLVPQSGERAPAESTISSEDSAGSTPTSPPTAAIPSP